MRRALGRDKTIILIIFNLFGVKMHVVFIMAEMDDKRLRLHSKIDVKHV